MKTGIISKKTLSIMLSAVMLSALTANLISESGAQDYTEQNSKINVNYLSKQNNNAEITCKPQPDLCDYSLLIEALDYSKQIPQDNDGRYSKSSWKTYANALKKALKIKPDLTTRNKNNQRIIDEAATNLFKAIETLENEIKDVIVITVKNYKNETVQVFRLNVNSNCTFEEILRQVKQAELPSENYKFVCWVDLQGNKIEGNHVITSDLVVTPEFEHTNIVIDESINKLTFSQIENEKYLHGLDAKSNSVADIKSNLENDNVQIIITKDNVTLEENELVGTGCVVKCVSRYDYSVIYDSAEVVLYGDINGDGKIDDDDRDVLTNLIFRNDSFNKQSAYFAAADLARDNAIDAVDYTMMNMQLTGARPYNQSSVLK